MSRIAFLGPNYAYGDKSGFCLRSAQSLSIESYRACVHSFIFIVWIMKGV